MKLTETLKNNISEIAEYAPMIASALGSPIAGTVVSLVAKAFGIDAANHDKVGDKLASPEAVEILKNLESTHSCWISAFLAAGRPSSIDLSFKVEWSS